MPLDIQLFPEEIIALNRELASGLHPELELTLKAIGGGNENWVERYAAIAAYCEVALDGMYTPDQIVAICAVLLPRLERRRKRSDKVEIILPLGA
jgi:hypothetical protein